VAQHAAGAEPLEVPAHVLAELLAAALLPHVPGQQLRVPPHHGADLAESGQGRDLVAGERRGEVAEQPRPTQAPAADHDAVHAGLLHHPQRVAGLPDVTVAEHRDVDVRDELGDRGPVGLAGVALDRGASVQRDRRDPGLLRDAAGVEEGEVVVVDALAGLHGDRHAVALAGSDRCLEDLAEQGALPGQRRAAALAGHLGYGAAEVEVDVGHAVLGAQDLGRLAYVGRVGAVELDRADVLALVEDQHLPGGGVALDQSAAGDHLADVETGGS
jgi:hypothetical protein